MFTRRALLGAAAASAAVSFTGAGEAVAATTLPLDLVARRTNVTTYAVVTGVDRATGRWFFLGANGKTKVYPRSVSRSMTALHADVAIRLPTSGAARRINLPTMDSGRIYFSHSRKLKFFVNPGRAVVAPSVTNPADANAATSWSFCELTYDVHGVYANISFVDFVGLPIGLRLDTRTGTQRIGGLRSDGLKRIAAGLRAQSTKDKSGWKKLVVAHQGKDLRILSPNLAAAAKGGRSPVAGYLDAYIDQVWKKYRTTTLRIDTQSAWGTVSGRVSSNGRLTFAGVGSFAKPSTHAVFNCSVTPFVTANNQMGNLSARLAAALNRTTLLANARQPDASAGQFYRAAKTNHYARLVHANTAAGAGYAFPYDDVHAGGFNAEGRVVDPHPRRLRIDVG